MTHGNSRSLGLTVAGSAGILLFGLSGLMALAAFVTERALDSTTPDAVASWWIGLAAIIVCVVGTLSSVGLLRRWDWGRRGMIVLSSGYLGAAVIKIGLWATGRGFQPSLGGEAEVVSLVNATAALAIVVTMGVSAALVLLIRFLMSPKTRREFRSAL